jgi:hypothetical protein
MEKVRGIVMFARVGKVTARGYVARLPNGRNVHASKSPVPTQNLVNASFHMSNGCVLPYQGTRSHCFSICLAEPGLLLLAVDVGPQPPQKKDGYRHVETALKNDSIDHLEGCFEVVVLIEGVLEADKGANMKRTDRVDVS